MKIMKVKANLVIVLLTVFLFFPGSLFCGGVYDLLKDIPENYREHFQDAEYQVKIYFKSTDCMSCLFILGKISEKLDLEDNTFAPLGLLDPRDTYPVKDLNKDSNLKFPIIQPGKEFPTFHWDNMPTPLILITDKSGNVQAIAAVPYATSDDKINELRDSIFDKTLFVKWRDESSKMFSGQK